MGTRPGKSGVQRVQISPDRAQDWISSVLNPIIEGLRRELRFLPGGPWDWHPRARKLERLGSIGSYVAEIFRDNYEDFLAKHRSLRRSFDLHDQLLGELARAVEAGHDRLMGPSGEELRRKYAHGNVEYIAAYLAGNFERVPEDFGSHELYNAAPDLQREGKELIRGELEKARKVGESLQDVSEKLQADPIALRSELADRYGARIKPVDFRIGY